MKLPETHKPLSGRGGDGTDVFVAQVFCRFGTQRQSFEFWIIE
ncbi:MAG TPA: hypothetical protein VFS55_00290 [Dokdonella sp.]|nr:hypothetical protein [Dokdonella sp.]